METALHAHLPKTTNLAINCCCIAHQALYWSDVSNGWGDRISPALLSSPSVAHSSSWAWPPEHPTKADWTIWKAFLNNSLHTILGSLAPSLDPWLHPPYWLNIIPFDASSNTASQPGHDLYWQVFLASSSRPYWATWHFLFHGLTVNHPSSSCLTRVKQQSYQVLLLSANASCQLQDIPMPSLWPLCSAHVPNSATGVAQALSSRTAVTICDGSYMPNCFPYLAVVAWIIHPCPMNLAPPCYGVTQVQGDPHSVNSYRAELQGLHVLLLAIHHICQMHNIQAGSLVIGCDNQGVLHHVLHLHPYTPSLLKHANIIRAIANLCRKCPVHLSFEYVAGHQDDLMHFEDLPLLAQLNIQADSLAKQALHCLGSQLAAPLFLHLPSLPWALLVGSVLVASHVQLSWITSARERLLCTG